MPSRSAFAEFWRLAALRGWYARLDPALALALAAWLFVVGRVGLQIFRYQHFNMDMDEAVHARDGQEYAAAFAQLDAGRLWQLFSRPQWHPPAYGLIAGLWFTLFESTVLCARLLSLAAFALLGVLTLVSVRALSEPRRYGLSSIALLFLATDPEQAANAAIAMLETPAALSAVLALLLHTRAVTADGRAALRLHVLATAAALLTFFIRYPHGLAVLGALGVAHALELGGALRRRVRPVFLPTLVFGFATVVTISVWLFGLDQLVWLRRYSQAQPAGVERWSFDNALYYPLLSLRNLPFGPLALLMPAVLVVRAIGLRVLDRRHTAYLAYGVISYLILFFVTQKEPRFGTMLGVPWWILGAGLLDTAVGTRGGERARLVVLVGAAVLVAVDPGGSQTRAFPAVYEGVGPEVGRAYAAIGSVTTPWARKHTEIVLLGRTDRLSGHALEFDLVSRCRERRAACEVSVRDEAELRVGWPRGSLSADGYQARLAHALERADFVVAYGRASKRLALARPKLLDETFSAKAKNARIAVAVFGPSEDRAARP